MERPGVGLRPSRPDDANTAALRAFDARGPRRPALHGDDPAPRRRAAHRHVARLSATRDRVAVRVRVRLFAIQRELAGTREVALELADGATVEDAWVALVERAPGPGARAGRRCGSRATAPTPTPTRRSPTATRWRSIPPVSGGSGTPRVLELARRAPFDAGILAELADRLARPRRRRGRRVPRPDPRRRPARRRRARRPRPPATPVGAWSRSSTRPTRRWRSRSSAAIADEIEARFGVDRRRDRPPDRRGAARRGRRSRSWRSPRIATPRSRPPATRSTRRRRGRRSGRRSGSPTATSGSASRRGPDRRRRMHEGLHQRRHGGHRRDQPPASDRTRRTSATRRRST